MILVISHRNGSFEDVKEINTISNLENFELVKIERGNKIKKHLRGVQPVFGVKDLYSVKMIKEALEIAERKAQRKTQKIAHYCMVCGEYTSTSDDGLCNECRI